MSESPSYDLLEKEWIPVVWRKDATEGISEDVGIRTALERAHEIRCISHTAPFIEFGLYRLLITIVLDALIVAGKRPTIGKVRAMIEERRFDDDLFAKYFIEYGKGFDLWSSSPFLQAPGLAEKSKRGDRETISKMISPIPNATKIAFWNHYMDGETCLTEAEVARELCAVSPFCFDYAPSDICTIVGDPPIYALVTGDNLFKTLILNLPRPNGRITNRQERESGPVWRTPVTNPKALPYSLTHGQAWTWPVRQIQLTRDDMGRIANAVNKAGMEKTEARKKVKVWRDPHSGTIADRNGIRHIRGTKQMLIWRDMVQLFLVASEGEVLRKEAVRNRPEVVTNALRMAQGNQLRIAVYGFIDKGGPNNKKFETWFRSVLTLPTEVARDSRLSARAIKSFSIAQKVADALQTALRMLRPPVKASKNKRPPSSRGETDALADFWQNLEPILRGSYMDALGNNYPKAEEELRDELRKNAYGALMRASGPHRRVADGLFRIANASNWFEGRLAKLMPKTQEEKKS